MNGTYVFDELGLYTGNGDSVDTCNSSSVQKSANRKYKWCIHYELEQVLQTYN